MDKHLMSHKELIKRLRALEYLLDEDATTRKKFESTRKLVKGINPSIDKSLKEISKLLAKIEKIKKGKVIELTAEALPQDTKKRRKRKKLILLLIGRVKSLKREVKRLRKEFENQEGQKDSFDKATSGAKILSFAKGPFGVITLIAAVVAGTAVFLNSRSVEVIINNESCDTVNLQISQNISLPGLKLPSEPIEKGESATAVVPPLKVSVDGTQNPIQVKAYGLTLSFNLKQSNINVLFNSSPIVGQRNEIDLGSRKTHEIILQCGR